MTRRARIVIGLVAAAAIATGCASGNAGGPAPSAPAGGAVITASGLAFDRRELDVPAGRAFPLLFENRELSPHNVAIYPVGSDVALFVGETFSGTSARTYQVSSLAAGTYRFRCDVHPDMSGTLIAQS
ncbi:MAG TPA: cupredoxin domain-containing protein [Candidatus Limnocylindrales bacterium]|nr:cupredoxin domain-containing protein [Candidatus Limnocylindrales bacterium]